MAMEKFWKINNKVNSKTSDPEILLYGPIASEKGWFGDEAIPQDFADDLKSLDGKNVTVRINSPGGDVFAAHAIHNLLLNHNGKVTCVIDGLAASAATIVAMGASKIIMPANSMMMIHNPKMCMNDYCDADELSTIAESLNKVKDSIIAAYQKRCKLSAEELAEMMSKETWLTAEECLQFGFADKIEGKVSAAINGNTLVVNSVSYDLSGFKNAAVLKNKLEGGMTNMTKLDMILNRLGLLDEVQDTATASQPIAANKEQVLAEERARVEALDAVEITNDAVKAIVAKAKANGKTVADIQEYIDAVKGINLDAQRNFANEVEDNKNSGVENVGANAADNNTLQQQKDEQAKAMFAKFMKRGK